MSDQPNMKEIWKKLSETKENGTYQKRLVPHLNFNATITNPGQLPGLYLRSAKPMTLDQSELAGSDQVSITVLDSDRDGSSIQFTLAHEMYREMFDLLIEDLVPRVSSQLSDEAAVKVLVRRFNAWQRFLKRSAVTGLSQLRQQGLYGELKVLQEVLLDPLGSSQALQSWTGPARQPQDFQFAGIGIEVKTVVQSEPQILTIDGERQLDDFGLDALVLAHLRIFKHSDAGEKLPELVESLRAHIASDGGGGAVEQFDDLLLAAGYTDAQAGLYALTGYSVKDVCFYRVQPGFPRLTESDLLPGVGKLKYSISAAACAQYAIDKESVISWLTEHPPVVDPQLAPESLHVEYKQTAWTPAPEQRFDSPQHERSVVNDLRTSVIKTIVGFMNADGGELVIGVEDAGATVTGIEPDLISKGLKPDDRDRYEQLLVSLLSEHIDRLAHSQVRVRFQDHEEGTTCHLTVRRSPSPRFGYPPPVENERRQPIFWVRVLNTTQQLDGMDIINYVREHWS